MCLDRFPTEQHLCTMGSTFLPSMSEQVQQEQEELDENLPPEGLLLREMRLEVAREAEEGQREASRDWAKPLERRVEEGLAVEGVWCEHKGDG